MRIGVPLESALGEETRVAVTPETAKKLVAQGHVVRVQSGAGVAASVTDAAYQAAGAEITDAGGRLRLPTSCSRCARPTTASCALMKPGTVRHRHAQPLRCAAACSAWRRRA